MTDAAGQRASRARSPRRCATRPCDVGPIAEGDFLGIARDGIRAVEPTARRRPPPACSTRWSTDDHEIVTVIEGEGATAADTRRITEWLDEHRPDVDGRGPPRRPAALPLPLRRRVDRHVPRPTGPGPLRAAGRSMPVTDARTGVGAGKKARGARPSGRHRDRARPAHALPPALRRPHQRGARSPTCAVGEEAHGPGRRSQRVVDAGAPAAGRKALVEVDVTDGSGHLRVTFFNQPWRERQLRARHDVVFFGKLEIYRGPQADDQPGRRPGRRPHRPHRPHLPAVGEGRR